MMNHSFPIIEKKVPVTAEATQRLWLAQAEIQEGWAAYWTEKGDMDQAEGFRREAEALRKDAA